jgi:hypothetical protein
VQLDKFEPSMLHVKFAIPKLSIPINVKLTDVEDEDSLAGNIATIKRILESSFMSFL